jgi:hypothetical protein
VTVAPNNPLQPTVKKLRFLPSAELSRYARSGEVRTGAFEDVE